MQNTRYVHSLKPLILLVAILLVVTVGCSQKSSSSGPKQAPPAQGPLALAGGTSDPGGGGEIDFSTDEEVIAAIKRARAFLTSAKGRAYLTESLPKVIPAGESKPSLTLREAVAKISEGDLEAKLSRSTIQFKTDDTKEKNCAPASYGAYPDAYTQDLKLGAGVCFNIHRLRRLTPESLYRNLISLWLHEIAHLHGYGESVAQAMGELSGSAIVKLETVSALDTFQAIYGILRSSLRNASGLHFRTNGRAAIVHVMMKEVIAAQEFKGFLVNLDQAFALDDEKPMVKEKVRKFIEKLGGLRAMLETYYRNKELLESVSQEKLTEDLQHASLCVNKSLLEIAEDLKYERQMKIDTWTAFAAGIRDPKKEKCD